MLVKKQFKGQTHIFDMEENLAKKLLLADKRYSIVDEPKKDLEQKKVRNGNDRK